MKLDLPEIILKKTTSAGQRKRVIIERPATKNNGLTELEVFINDNDFVDY